MKPPARYYLLLDGAQIDDLMPTMYQLEPNPEFYRLYERTRYAELADVGPVLIATNESSELSRHFKRHWSATAGLSLDSTACPEDLVQHLSSMVHVKVSDAIVLFRFYDPRILPLWLADMNDKQRHIALGPAERFRVQVSGEFHSYASAAPGGHQRYADVPWLQLSGEQLTLFNQAKQDVFEQDLLDHVDAWFPNCLAQADAKERRNWARACYAKATEYGFSAAVDIVRWAGLVAICGSEFPDAEEHQVYKALLHQSGMLPGQKLDALRVHVQRRVLGLDKDYAE